MGPSTSEQGGISPDHDVALHAWRPAAFLVAIGAIVLGAGLLLGPTPSDDAAEALRDIDGFRTRYIVTNAIDLVGVLVMAAGLVLLARQQVRAGGGAFALIGGVANAAGGALIALTVVLQSTVDPAVAERFVEAGGTEQEALLAVGETVLDISNAVFGTAFLLQMLGVALLAIAFLVLRAPRLNRAFLGAGALLALAASTLGIGALFEDVLGEIEAIIGLIVLVWLIALAVLLVRAGRGSSV